MATNALTVREPNQLTNDQLSYIANTEFVPQGLRGNKPAILACVMTGRALGLDDMSSLRLIHVVNGRPTFSAELMVQIVRRHGHSISGSVGDGKATVTGKRADTGDEMTSEWTLAMAQRAGLANKQVWKAYPEAMLWARAVSQLCRMLFADCFAGGTYTPEELSNPDVEDAEFAEEPLTAIEAAPVVAPAEDALAPSSAQIKKLNVLVGKLRESGEITTEGVWAAAGRDHDTYDLGADGVLHWSPLRDSLTKPEASTLIEHLTQIESSGRDRGDRIVSNPDVDVSVEGSSRPEVVPLSVAEFRRLTKEAGVSPAAGQAVLSRVFPGVEKSSDLTNDQRGQLWVELAGVVTA